MNKERTALVTGANRGIGLEVCRQLAARDFAVFLAARREEEGVKACGQLRETGVSASFLQLDVTDAGSIDAAAKTLASQADHLDVLVNNAGVCEDQECSILELSVASLRRTFEINTFGPLLMVQSFWKLLAESGASRVINVSSGLGSLNTMSSGYPGYRMSKTALNASTRILAAELAPLRIAVNCVSPGWVRTDMGGPNATNSVEEGADTIVWLATEAPQALTGQFIGDRKTLPW